MIHLKRLLPRRQSLFLLSLPFFVFLVNSSLKIAYILMCQFYLSLSAFNFLSVYFKLLKPFLIKLLSKRSQPELNWTFFLFLSGNTRGGWAGVRGALSEKTLHRSISGLSQAVLLLQAVTLLSKFLLDCSDTLLASVLGISSFSNKATQSTIKQSKSKSISLTNILTILLFSIFSISPSSTRYFCFKAFTKSNKLREFIANKCLKMLINSIAKHLNKSKYKWNKIQTRRQSMFSYHWSFASTDNHVMNFSKIAAFLWN